MEDPAPWLSLDPYIVCPTCRRVSYNERDVAEAFCGACYRFHLDMPTWPLDNVHRLVLLHLAEGHNRVGEFIAYGGPPAVAIRQYRRDGLLDRGDRLTPAGRVVYQKAIATAPDLPRPDPGSVR